MMAVARTAVTTTAVTTTAMTTTAMTRTAVARTVGGTTAGGATVVVVVVVVVVQILEEDESTLALSLLYFANHFVHSIVHQHEEQQNVDLIFQTMKGKHLIQLCVLMVDGGKWWW